MSAITLDGQEEILPFFSIPDSDNTSISIRSIVSETLFLTAQYIASPLWTVCSHWMTTIVILQRNDSSTFLKVEHTFKTVFASFFFLPIVCVALPTAQTVHSIAYALSETPFTYMKGEFIEKTDKPDSFTISQWNTCITAGNVAKLVGGVFLDDMTRTQKIGTKIHDELNSDILCLQEMSDLRRAYQLIDKIKDQYAHFYFNIGPGWCVLQNNSGLFVASKYTIYNPRFVSFHGIPGIESMVNKGCFIFETILGTICNFHLSPSKQDDQPTEIEIECRKEELSRINQSIDASAPYVLLGDWNQEKEGKPNTCFVDALKDLNGHGLTESTNLGYAIDYLETIHHVADTALIAAHDLKKPKEALSDHHALQHTIVF